MTGEKEGHKCFDHYRRVDRKQLICDMCGKVTTLENKKNPVKDFIGNIYDGI
jgi:Fe2+ or Zn2+ uptake regulation protein